MNQLRGITIPTVFTLCRFLLVPVFISLFFQERYKLAVVTLVAASLTDMLDGFIARRYNMRSRLGSMLDPLADKFMMLVSFFALSYSGTLPWWMTFLVIGRDTYIVFGAIYLNNILRINLVFKPTKFSKVTTTSQFFLLALSFLAVFISKRTLPVDSGVEIVIIKSQVILLWTAAALTAITFVQYTKIGIGFLRHGERKPPRMQSPPSL